MLAELDALGLASNTVVIFTSDHGDYLGDHQLMLKGPIHYRGLTRVPFIWRDPASAGRPGAASVALLSTIDVAPTVLARAGVQPYNGIQGRDMAGLIAGRETALRDALMIEEEGQRVILGFDSRIRCRTLLAEGFRATVYDGARWGELYDLARDPHETRNLWDDPAHAGVRARLMERLAYGMLEHIDTSPYPRRWPDRPGTAYAALAPSLVWYSQFL